MKYRSRPEYMHTLRTRLLSNLKASPKMILKGRLMNVIKTWQGFFSAIRWGIRNKRLP